MSDNKDRWPSEGLIGAVAQGWCTEANGGKEMDSDLAFDIATSVHRYLQSLAAQPVVLSDERCYAILHEMAEHMLTMPDESFTEAQFCGESVRFILNAAKEQA